MKYTQLTSAYKYDTIADAIYAREVEYFHYDFDRANFQHLLANTDDEEFKSDVAQRLASTLGQMQKVESIMAALRSQIDDQQAYDAAVIRTTAKRAAKEKESK
jgi:predicted negative regulator of RcsB-dependent stress response